VLSISCQGKQVSQPPIYLDSRAISTVSDIGVEHLIYLDRDLQLINLLEEKNVVNNFISHRYSQDGTTAWSSENNVQAFCDPNQCQLVASHGSRLSEIPLPQTHSQTPLPEPNSDQLNNQMLSMACHELRSSLTVIAATNDLLKLHSQKMTAEQRSKYFQKISDTVKNTAELIEGFLAISKADLGHQLNPDWVNFPNFCQEVWQDIQQITESEDQFIFTNHWGLQSIVADSLLLRQILVNLLLNAVKYSPESSTICCEFAGNDREVMFSVTDRGIGIPPEDIETLFEPFHRAQNTGKAKGTGLGLTIVKRAVELHGGQIFLESEVGVGTTFTVRLPRLIPIVERKHSHSREREDL
jgi:signal transduction histidine kinase